MKNGKRLINDPKLNRLQEQAAKAELDEANGVVNEQRYERLLNQVTRVSRSQVTRFESRRANY